MISNDTLVARALEQLDHDCTIWNTRVALLNLCRDILGEQE